MERTQAVAGPIRKQTSVFFAVTYAISWVIWVPVALSDLSPSSPVLALIFLGSFGPTLAAIMLTTFWAGRSGLSTLLNRLLKWRVGLRWYAVVLLGPFAVVLAAVAVNFLIGGPPLSFGGSQIPQGLPGYLVFLLLVPAFLAGTLFGGPLGEEVGWRGYALPRLQSEYGALISSLILGVVWAFWHLPLFFIAGTTQSFLPFLAFVVWVISLSILLTWAYNGSGGSLLICVVLHGAVKFSAAVFAILPARGADPTLPFVIYTGQVLLVAVVVAALIGYRS